MEPESAGHLSAHPVDGGQPPASGERSSAGDDLSDHPGIQVVFLVLPLAVLLPEQGAHEAKDQVDVRKDACGIRVPFDFPVKSFVWIGAVKLVLPSEGKLLRRQDIVLGLDHRFRDLGILSCQLIGHLLPTVRGFARSIRLGGGGIRQGFERFPSISGSSVRKADRTSSATRA